MVPRDGELDFITLSRSLENEFSSVAQKHMHVEPANAAIAQARWIGSVEEADEIEPLASQETRT